MDSTWMWSPGLRARPGAGLVAGLMASLPGMGAGSAQAAVAGPAAAETAWATRRAATSIEATTRNDAGAEFGELCTLAERRCHWMLRTPAACTPGAETPLLASSPSGSAALTVRCAGAAGPAGSGYRQDFTDWEPLERLLGDEGTLSLAWPAAGGEFSVQRFALAGHAAAQAAAESVALGDAPAARARRVLFIGNSFLFGAGTPVQAFHPESVTDLNRQQASGVPALVARLLAEGGHPAEVALETWPGVGLDWHLANRREALLADRYDVVVMHGYSTLDKDHPGDGALLARSVASLATLLAQRSPGLDLRLMVTWPRADQVYPRDGHWHGHAPADMLRDLRGAYERAARGAPAVRGLVPVGDAFVRAMREGVADDDPYDGIAPGLIDLWGDDHYHASSAGYYLEALVIYGALTGEDPRALGASESAATELGLPEATRTALQRIAAEELQAQGLLPRG